MVTDGLADKPSPGSKMRWEAPCGHMMLVYALVPTPAACPDCQDIGRKVLADIVQAFDFRDLDDIPTTHELSEWMDECGVTDDRMRADINELAQIGDDINSMIERGDTVGRLMLQKYPPAKRLTMED